MKWGHKISRGDEQIDVTRAEYNQAFGVAVPEQPEIPDVAMHAWLIWWRLNARRPAGEHVNPLSYTEAESFCRLTGTILLPEDMQMIEAIDNAFIASVAEERKAMFDRIKNEKPKGNGK